MMLHNSPGRYGAPLEVTGRPELFDAADLKGQPDLALRPCLRLRERRQ